MSIKKEENSRSSIPSPSRQNTNSITNNKTPNSTILHNYLTNNLSNTMNQSTNHPTSEASGYGNSGIVPQFNTSNESQKDKYHFTSLNPSYPLLKKLLATAGYVDVIEHSKNPSKLKNWQSSHNISVAESKGTGNNSFQALNPSTANSFTKKPLQPSQIEQQHHPIVTNNISLNQPPQSPSRTNLEQDKLNPKIVDPKKISPKDYYLPMNNHQDNSITQSISSSAITSPIHPQASSKLKLYSQMFELMKANKLLLNQTTSNHPSYISGTSPQSLSTNSPAGMSMSKIAQIVKQSHASKQLKKYQVESNNHNKTLSPGNKTNLNPHTNSKNDSYQIVPGTTTENGLNLQHNLKPRNDSQTSCYLQSGGLNSSSTNNISVSEYNSLLFSGKGNITPLKSISHYKSNRNSDSYIGASKQLNAQLRSASMHHGSNKRAVNPSKYKNPHYSSALYAFDTKQNATFSILNQAISEDNISTSQIPSKNEILKNNTATTKQHQSQHRQSGSLTTVKSVPAILDTLKEANRNASSQNKDKLKRQSKNSQNSLNNSLTTPKSFSRSNDQTYVPSSITSACAKALNITRAISPPKLINHIIPKNSNNNNNSSHLRSNSKAACPSRQSPTNYCSLDQLKQALYPSKNRSTPALLAKVLDHSESQQAGQSDQEGFGSTKGNNKPDILKLQELINVWEDIQSQMRGSLKIPGVVILKEKQIIEQVHKGIKMIKDYDQKLQPVSLILQEFLESSQLVLPALAQANAAVILSKQARKKDAAEFKMKLDAAEQFAQNCNKTLQQSQKKLEMQASAVQTFMQQQKQIEQLAAENEQLEKQDQKQKQEIQKLREREGQIKDLLIQLNKKGLLRFDSMGNANIGMPSDDYSNDFDKVIDKNDGLEENLNHEEFKRLLMKQFKGQNENADSSQLADDSIIDESEESSFGFVGKLQLANVEKRKQEKQQYESYPEQYKDILKLNVAAMKESPERMHHLKGQQQQQQQQQHLLDNFDQPRQQQAEPQQFQQKVTQEQTQLKQPINAPSHSPFGFAEDGGRQFAREQQQQYPKQQEQLLTNQPQIQHQQQQLIQKQIEVPQIILEKPVMKRLELGSLHNTGTPHMTSVIEQRSPNGQGRGLISKIEIEDISGQGYHDEFMSRLNEFSLSWREAAKRERQPSKN